MNVGWIHRARSAASISQPQAGARAASCKAHPCWPRWLSAGAAAATIAALVPAGAGQAAATSAARAPAYQATIVRTAYGIPHITARGLAYQFVDLQGQAADPDGIATAAPPASAAAGAGSR